ncbi:proline-rich receptor-like protein kinase PERK3 [Selaginella moellendorffii]|nr:proline-rich receptor-like protein kinase PERK3 [Selaginella moellendorffii]|eukprot:XP_002992136.2 proline-rich receptor-like protein kinase PERK3 [Selaginella moellendorffii]
MIIPFQCRKRWLLVTLCAFLMLQSFETGAASVEEGDELRFLKRSLGDPEVLESWREESDPCQSRWYGVTCSNTNSVSELDLSNLLLQGSLASGTFAKLPGLTKLVLANNSFTGDIPDSLFGLSSLTHLDVSYNLFSGMLGSGFEHLTKLQILSLTGNPFNTGTQLDFRELIELEYVLLGGCGFTQSLPPGIFLLPKLYALDLEGNSFSGALTDEIRQTTSPLTVLGLQNSGISVDLNPTTIRYFQNLRYLSLPEDVIKYVPTVLQGRLPSIQNSLCMYVAWIKCETPSRAKPKASDEPAPPPRAPKSKNTAAIIGGVVGGAAFFIASSCLAIYCILARRQKCVVTDFTVKAGLELEVVTSSQSFVVAHAFTYAELEQATDKFNMRNLVGEGSFGQVFRGILTNGKVVAIKRMDRFAGQCAEAEKEFRIEVDLLSRMNHPHLVRLFGYCADGSQRLIVYEFMSNGSLESYFAGRCLYRSGFKLDFRRRLLISLGCAKGLAFLHAGGEDGDPIVHRDFKSSNILLDSYFSAKISDFGFAKLLQRNQSHASTRVIGTFGYFDPHYTATGRLTVKADVYSFGVVLLQLLTGKPAVVSFGGDDVPQNIVSWAEPCLSDKRKLRRILDKDLGSTYPPKCAHKLALLASCCLRENAEARPSMAQCVQTIEEILVECAMHLENV